VAKNQLKEENRTHYLEEVVRLALRSCCRVLQVALTFRRRRSKRWWDSGDRRRDLAAKSATASSTAVAVAAGAACRRRRDYCCCRCCWRRSGDTSRPSRAKWLSACVVTQSRVWTSTWRGRRCLSSCCRTLTARCLRLSLSDIHSLARSVPHRRSVV